MCFSDKFSAAKECEGWTLTPMGANADSLPEILTAREFEALIRVDVKTIYRYVQQGLIPYLRMESAFPNTRSCSGSKSGASSPGR
jgi:hypothetical protein